MRSIRLAAALSLAMLLLAACETGDAGETPPVPPSPVEDRVYPEKGVVHWKSFHNWDEGMIAQAAQAKIMILPLEWCFSPESREALAAIRDRNADIRVIGYRTLMCVATLYPDTAYLRAALPYVLDYYHAVRDDWAWTTTQDTVLIWRDIMMLDPIVDGALNMELIDEMVDLIARHNAAAGGAVDGIMHDYFMYSAYLNPLVRATMTGEIDFDDDGVRHEDDADERALFYEWQKEYARAITARLGDGFIQIGNGRPPQEDASLAGLLNGIFYELFPNNPWWGTDRSGLLTLLENQRPGWLRETRGRTWSICTNERGHLYGNNIFCLLSSLLAGCLYTELNGTYVFTGWALSYDTGDPVAAAAISGRTDTVLTVTRPFDRGKVRISFEPSGRRIEAAFQSAE